MAAIATVTGTAIRPGVSKNNRLYTAEAIGRMVERAQARIADGGMPLTTLTHHEAGDDSTRIVGRITRIAQEADGSVSYDAELADTGHGRDILSLVSGPSPVLKGVSIRGAWVGRVRKESGPNGVTVETGDDLELDGLDYTRKPGVPGAEITAVALTGAEPRESDGTQRVPIAESAPEATVTLTETATESGPYADPAYHGEPRLPVGTRTQAKAAWVALAESETARQYTSAQLKRVKQRVGKALKGFGVTVESAGDQSWLADAPAPLSECFGYSDDPGHGGDLAVTMSNGPITVTISSWCVDPHDLMAVGRAAMTGACGALATIDPDMDADIDVPGAAAEDADDDTDESAPTAIASPAAVTAPVQAATETTLTQTPAPETPAAEPTQEKEPAMAESTPTPAATTPGTDSGIDALSAKFDKLTDAITGLVTKMAPTPAVESAPTPAAVAATAAVEVPVAETDDQRIQRLVAEGIKAALPGAIQENVERNGPPTRKGLVTQVSEHTAPAAGSGLNAQGLPADWPDKELHDYTDDERSRYFGPALESHVFGNRTN